MIDYRKVTFVLQGPPAVSENINSTKTAISSIKQHYPGSQIIFSTWEGCDSEDEYDVDLLLINTDPGGLRVPCGKRLNNVNRQLVSSLNGLRKVKTQYAVKVRSDLIFTSSAFLNQYPHHKLYRDPSFGFSEQWLLSANITSKDPSLTGGIAFHPSDWLTFGLTSDLVRIFSAELISTRDHVGQQLAPEQYIWISYCRNFIPVPEKVAGWNQEEIELSNRTIANNIIIVNEEDCGIFCATPNYSLPLGKNGFLNIRHERWQELYNLYVQEVFYHKKAWRLSSFIRRVIQRIYYYSIKAPKNKLKRKKI